MTWAMWFDFKLKDFIVQLVATPVCIFLNARVYIDTLAHLVSLE